MTTKGIVEVKIKTSFKVGSIACWQDYDKSHHKDAFVLKNHEDGSFHVVEINGTTAKEICKFEIEVKANANYKDETKEHKQHSLDGLYKVKKRLV